jgi:transcription antitermination factor NusG
MPRDSLKSPFKGFSKAGRTFPMELYQEARWYACRTRARAEKMVGKLLGQAGFEAYLPLVQKERQWSDRKKRVAFPLFPGYTFVRFDLNQYDDVVRIHGIVDVVKPSGYPSPLREEELESVRRLVAGMEETAVEPIPADFFDIGDSVLVTCGPFRGMRGLLLEKRGQARVAIRLTAIRQAVSVHLDLSTLRLLA